MGGKTVFMFPGQGSQYVGMRARLGTLSGEQIELFRNADGVLGFDLSGLIDSGPEEELTRTSNAQPALLVMGLAYSLSLQQKGYAAEIAMGHSLGEYAALVFAGVMDAGDGLKLVRERGRLMEKAVKDIPGRMAAVIGADREKLEALVSECSRKEILEITNFNSSTQVVLSGAIGAVEEAVRLVNERQLGRAMELNVSAPFHSSLMKPVAEEFKDVLSKVPFRVPRMIFIDNVTGLPESDPDRIREKLVAQLFRPVMWEKSVLTAHGLGAAVFVESGPGSVLSGLVKRIVPGISIVSGEKALRPS